METFPTDWRRALVVVAHPDDPEYGMAAAVSFWSRHGKRVDYVMISSGEAGIEGMPPEQCGPVREDEQRRSAGKVGVDDVEFLGFPDSRIENSPGLRSAIAQLIDERQPDLLITLFTGEEFAPGLPNQRDHMEGGAAVREAARTANHRPRWVFESSPNPTHTQVIEAQDVEAAVASLAEHTEYLSVLDPDTPVPTQARRQVEAVCLPDDGSDPRVGFELVT